MISDNNQQPFMVEKDEWVSFKEILWNCPRNNRFNVDTRDFHCGYNFSDETHPDYHKILNYPSRFFFTETELITALDRLYVESGGEKGWRCIELNSTDKRVINWNLKYLRIWRTEKGFLICNDDQQAIPKNILSCDIRKDLL